MAKKKVNRKKILRKQWLDVKRASLKTVEKAVETAEKVKDDVVEKSKDVTETVTSQVEKAEHSLKEIAGLSEARLKTFYDEGIKKVADFAKWSEKELLALKGIGPATIKILKEHGIDLKD